MSTSVAGNLVVIGGGNMGAALVGGLISTGTPVSDLVVVEVSDQRGEALGREFPGLAIVSQVPPCFSVLIAVKPKDVLDACAVAAAQGATRIVSIAAGVSVAQLEAAAGAEVAVVRTMPNTPALVGQGVTAVCSTPSSDDAALAWAESLFQAVGIVVRIPETAVDVFTGLIGSGPAYLFHVAEGLIAAGQTLGREHGLDPSVVEAVVGQLFIGSAALLTSGRGSASQLREMVTSPNGTTAAGLEVLYRAQLLQTLVQTVTAAANRSAEITVEMGTEAGKK